MLAALGRWGSPVWIGGPRLINKLAVLLGNPSLPFLNIAGFPCVASANSPAQLTLVDASDILFADDDNVSVEFAQSASLVMSDATSSPVSAELVSLFQRNSVAIRIIRELAWQRGHDSSVVWMSVNY